MDNTRQLSKVHLRGEENLGVTCVSRSLTLSVLNYFEIIFCFTTLYVVAGGPLLPAGSWADALYFSIVTQLTVGYGDIRPGACSV